MNSPFDPAAFIPFANLINGKDDFFRILEEIEGTKRFLFRDKMGPISLKAGEYLSPDLSRVFGQIEQLGLEPTTDDKQQDFLNDIMEFLKTIPVVKIIFAFEPTASFVAGVNSKLSNAVGKKIILDYAVDEDIVGGVKIEYLGKFGDFSLEPAVETFLKGKIQELNIS